MLVVRLCAKNSFSQAAADLSLLSSLLSSLGDGAVTAVQPCGLRSLEGDLALRRARGGEPRRLRALV